MLVQISQSWLLGLGMNRWPSSRKNEKAARQPTIHGLQLYRQVRGAADVLGWVSERFENRVMIASAYSSPYTLFVISELTQLLILSDIGSQSSFKLIFLDILGSD